MKIVFVLPDMPGGGSERVVAMLANEYIKRGYEAAVLLFAGNRTAYPLDDKIEVFIAGEPSDGNPWIQLKRLFQMRRYYRKNKGCYIFSFCVRGSIFSVLAAAGIPHRLLISERNDPTRISGQRLRDWSYRRAEKLILQTEDMKRCFSADIQRKSAVIPNPVSDDMPEPFMGERKKQIVAVGRLQPQKNHKLLLEAFADFQKKYMDYELHIFGIGELENELKQQAKALHIADKVVFRGFSSTVQKEIWDSAMFVLSSDYEGISNSMIEALAMGVPVISTDCPVGGARTYIENNKNGILVPVGDRDALSEAMMKIVENPRFAQMLSMNGAKIKEQYGLEKIADRFLEEAGIGKTAGRNCFNE
ncbi:MAG: glycosyltransferase [Blautia sp.]|nr:glycosyltransferase [Blautia sp.]MCM1200548.1 glycosyltransferase [Bacteroides fragilis]